MFIIHVNFSFPTWPSWTPDPFFRIYISNIHRTKVSLLSCFSVHLAFSFPLTFFSLAARIRYWRLRLRGPLHPPKIRRDLPKIQLLSQPGRALQGRHLPRHHGPAVRQRLYRPRRRGLRMDHDVHPPLACGRRDEVRRCEGVYGWQYLLEDREGEGCGSEGGGSGEDDGQTLSEVMLHGRYHLFK
jgi:hypothetical protein